MNMENVDMLPTAATSYYTVRKVRGGWGVILTTPSGYGKSLTTQLYTFPDREAAIEYGRTVAARMNRPFIARGAE